MAKFASPQLELFSLLLEAISLLLSLVQLVFLRPLVLALALALAWVCVFGIPFISSKSQSQYSKLLESTQSMEFSTVGYETSNSTLQQEPDSNC